MRVTILFSILAVLSGLVVGCFKESPKEVWIYTSLYKDTIADIQPKLEADFPGVKFNFFQAGSEDIATRVNAEKLAGNTKVDILISSDRFWYEDLANQGALVPFKPTVADQIDASFKHAGGLYTAVSIPVMVLAYNTEALGTKAPPKGFSELADSKWKDAFTTGSPLESGTNFTTVAFLVEKYGWDFFKKLKDNNTLSQGGNSAVMRRLQTKEKPVGWVLLENMLRVQSTDQRLKTVIPSDGAVMHNNVLAIMKKEDAHPAVAKVADWFFGSKGQEAMIRSFMYSPITNSPDPVGAPSFKEIKEKAMPWSEEFVKKTVSARDKMKETYTEIMFK